MDTQDNTTVIYVRNSMQPGSPDESLATQEQACQSYAAARGLRVGNLIPHQELERHRRARQHQHADRTEKPAPEAEE
jgi:hypothetical protein